jgi:cardiolipin synthase
METEEIDIGCTGECEIICANPACALSIDDLVKHAAGYPEAYPHLRRMVRTDQSITGRPLYTGNDIELLIDGPMAYAAMFEAMRRAAHHIHVETFIFDDEDLGIRFADILVERRRAGVAVRLIYDAFGILDTEAAFFHRLASEGIEFFKYNPLNPIENLEIWQINQRHHRKILVVDGRIAFVGGMNISSVYRSSSFSPPNGLPKLKDRWRDTHLRLEGPVVTELQQMFVTLWSKLTETDPLAGPAYFPDLPPAGDKLVRVMVSTAGDEEVDIYKVFLTIFHQARERIWVTQGYFSPDERFLNILKRAARRGVDVRLLLPGATDSWITINSSRAHYGELLEAGARVFERKDALQHAKTAVVDGHWSTVGSSNLDYRSFLHANEANAIIYGADFGNRMEAMFLKDQEENVEITMEAWRKRSMMRRATEVVGSLFDYWL